MQEVERDNKEMTRAFCCKELKELDYWMDWSNIGDTDEFNYCPFHGKKLEENKK